MKKILVTGSAGFIGSHLCDKLLELGNSVVGIDNFNDYYDPEIKEKNIKDALGYRQFKLYREDILNSRAIGKIFIRENPQTVVHLAARAGIRASVSEPVNYAKVNIEGTINLLTASQKTRVNKFILGSSSSVYGDCRDLPFKEDNSCEAMISPYGASKRAAEFFVESFHKSSNLKSIILRFFTVYGPRGRVDMAPAIFARSILRNKTVSLFGNGLSSRDYTYIDDIIDGILKAIEAEIDYGTINLGGDNPVSLNDFINILEQIIGQRARIKYAKARKGDVEKTWASIEKAKKELGWEPKVLLREGLMTYVKWLKGQR